jgi:hypothetical protein
MQPRNRSRDVAHVAGEINQVAGMTFHAAPSKHVASRLSLVGTLSLSAGHPIAADGSE